MHVSAVVQGPFKSKAMADSLAPLPLFSVYVFSSLLYYDSKHTRIGIAKQRGP